MRQIFQHFLTSLEYLYHLRFSLVLWISPAILAIVGGTPQSPSSFLHAVLTPQYFGQFFISTFCAACTGILALILARVVCINGGERFYTAPPHLLFALLGISEEWPPNNGQQDRAATPLVISQLPTLFALLRIHENSMDAGVSLPRGIYYAVPMLLGLIAAGLFWWLVDMTYHATYPHSLFHRQARTLLFPGSWIYGRNSLEHSAPPKGLFGRKNLLYIVFDKLFNAVATTGAGYSSRAGTPAAGQLYEGHRLATIGLIGYLVIYVLLYPLTAPASVPRFGTVLLWIAVVISSIIALDHLPILLRRNANWKSRLFFGIPALVFGTCIWFLYLTWKIGHAPFVYFPVLASLLLLITILCCTFAGMAFFLDRHKLPLLIAIALVVLLLPRLSVHGTGEHFFHAATRKTTAPIPGPADILATRCKPYWEQEQPCNMIFITATGGGIHAAVWTAGILTDLESEFAEKLPKVPSFDQQLAFASTVSGGSVGFADFLRHYRDKGNSPSKFIEAPNEAACSALEAVSWGLIYSDFVHLVIPIPRHRPGWDRSSALEWALERNAVTKGCRWTSDEVIPNVERNSLTLDDFALTSDTIARYPAFTMNTTGVEKGGRFLLANYRNDRTLNSFSPVSSFEEVYDANLNLATAARLSATYPIVSSAARIDAKFGPQTKGGRVKSAAHFVDGGYYDNDGIASALEFIEEAYLGDSPSPCSNPASGLVNILLIEIRDGPDFEGNPDEESSDSQQKIEYPMDLTNQLESPLTAFYNTGHGGISRRNYMEFASLQKALPANVKLYAEVLPFDGQTALSWQLTPRQRDGISGKIGGLNVQRDEIIGWEKWKFDGGRPPRKFLPTVPCVSPPTLPSNRHKHNLRHKNNNPSSRSACPCLVQSDSANSRASIAYHRCALREVSKSTCKLAEFIVPARDEFSQ